MSDTLSNQRAVDPDGDTLAALVDRQAAEIAELKAQAAALTQSEASAWERARELDALRRADQAAFGVQIAALDASQTAAWARAHELDRHLRDVAERSSREAHQARARADGLAQTLQAQARRAARSTYDADSLMVWDKDVSFLADPRFRRAYAAGMHSGHHIMRPAGSADDIHIEWRVHVICWAAQHAARLDGCFVECGVNTGIYSLAACAYVDFNSLDKDFFLFDTFDGIPESQMDESEREQRHEENALYYSDCFDLAQRNFAPFPRARLVRGAVPETLTTVSIERVCYLSIDMNIVFPEIAAIRHFWPKLVPGALVILDDYGWSRYRAQKAAMDTFAHEVGVEILLLPTGQGLIVKR